MICVFVNCDVEGHEEGIKVIKLKFRFFACLSLPPFHPLLLWEGLE